jgi:MFS transporter, DHA2 family, methylenomycin A resistance protein
MSTSVGSTARTARAPLSFMFVVGTTSLSFFMGQLDVTIVTVALPRIAAELHAGLSDLQWVVDAYTLAFAVAMLSAGALGDRLGVRRGLQLGMGLFAVASLACASAPSATWLTLARVFQGVGAAAMLPNSLALLNQAFSHDAGQRAKAVGWWTASGAISLALGPLLGGLLLTAFGWRWIFLVNLPVCALGLFLVARFPQGAAERLGGGLDITGQLYAAAALTLLTAGIIGSGHPGPGQRQVWLFLVTAVLCAALFVVVERRAPSPVLPRQLFAGRAFLPAAVTGW